MKAAHHKGHTKKHARAKTKHAKTAKHHPKHHALSPHQKHMAHLVHIHAIAKPASHAKAKALALHPDDVACCTIEALAASLRCQGLPVTAAEVLELFRLAGGDEDAGIPVRVALEAAAEFGLGGFQLTGFGQVPFGPALDPRQVILGVDPPGPLTGARPDSLGTFGGVLASLAEVPPPTSASQGTVTPKHPGPTAAGISTPPPPFDRQRPDRLTAIILGVDLPGDHAVLATPDGWWSWGDLWCPCEFPDAAVEEAWAISWAVAA